MRRHAGPSTEQAGSDKVPTGKTVAEKLRAVIVIVCCTALFFAIALGVAQALTLNAPAATSTSYVVNATANYTLGGMRTSNKPAETISNTATNTVLTFPNNFDLSAITGVSVPGQSATGSFRVTGQTLSIRWANAVAKNRAFTFVISGLRNPSQPAPGGTYTITGTVTTSLGTYNVSWPVGTAMTANANAVTAVISVPSTSAVSAASTYTVSFNLGAQGRLAGTTAAGANTIAVTFPNGTVVPAAPSVANLTVNGIAPAAVSTAGQTVTITMPSGMTIANNAAVTVVFRRAFGLTNPPVASTTYQVGVTTSAQTTVGMSAGYTIGDATTRVNLGSSAQPAASFGGPGKPMLVDGFSLQRVQGSDPVTVSAVTFNNAGTAPAATISGVSVYKDDGDAIFDASDTLLNATPATFVGTAVVVTFDTALRQGLNDSMPYQYWVVYAVSGAAADGDTASSQATTFTAVSPLTSLSAVTGSTFTIDTGAPSLVWSAPSVDSTTLTDPGSTVLVGTASDARSGVASVGVQIQRTTDSLWWTGAAWSGSAATLTAGGTINWTAVWNYGSQNGDVPYTLRATPFDAVGNVGATVIRTGIRVDNMGPTVVSAVALDATHVDVRFSEAITSTDTASLLAAFSFDNGLSASAASIDASQSLVHLTTGAQAIAVNYTVTVAPGGVKDLVGNESEPPDSAVFLSGAVPTVVVTQGAHAGRPSTTVYKSRNTTAVVDEIVVTASGGSVSVTTMTVRGLDTVDALQTDASAALLYLDNGDGLFGAGDTQVSSTKTFSANASGTAVTFNAVGTTVVPGFPKSFWVAYRIGPAATQGNALGSRVVNGDVRVASGVVSTITPIVSAAGGQTIVIDYLPPTLPASIGAAPLSTSSIEVTWTPSADPDAGVAFYRIFQDGSLVATSTTPTYTASGLNPGQTYTYSLTAVDNAGNETTPAVVATASVPTAALWMTVETSGPGQSVDLGVADPGVTTTLSNATTITVSGVGVQTYDFSVSADDFVLDTTASVPPTMPASAMSYISYGWASVGPLPFSTAPSLVSTGAGTKYLWSHRYQFDLLLAPTWEYDPGTYDGKIMYTAVPF